MQKGSLKYIDILKLVSEGKSSMALGNIVGAPYAAYLLPPPSAYFSFRSYLALVENKPEKDYRMQLQPAIAAQVFTTL